MSSHPVMWKSSWNEVSCKFECFLPESPCHVSWRNPLHRGYNGAIYHKLSLYRSIIPILTLCYVGTAVLQTVQYSSIKHCECYDTRSGGSERCLTFDFISAFTMEFLFQKLCFFVTIDFCVMKTVIVIITFCAPDDILQHYANSLELLMVLSRFKITHSNAATLDSSLLNNC
jgi:hypothetical protein